MVEVSGRDTFRGKFIYSMTFCHESAKRKSPKKYFIFISFFRDVWVGEVCTLKVYTGHALRQFIDDLLCYVPQKIYYSINF